MVDTLMKCLRSSDWDVRKNGIRIVGYLDSSPEFFDQIITYNDFYQNIELQDAI